MGGLKLDPADIAFSKYIRLRDKNCRRCHSPVLLNESGLPVTHQASHYFGRGRECTRFDPDNVDTLCHGCHKIWGSDDKESYRDFKINQLGQAEFDRLKLRANMTCRKDRKMSLLQAKALLESLNDQA